MRIKKFLITVLMLTTLCSMSVSAEGTRGAGVKQPTPLPYESNYLSNGSREDLPDFSNAATILNDELGLNFYYIKYEDSKADLDTLMAGQIGLQDSVDVLSDGNAVICYAAIPYYTETEDGLECQIYPTQWQFGANAREVLGANGIEMFRSYWENQVAYGEFGSYMSGTMSKIVKDVKAGVMPKDSVISPENNYVVQEEPAVDVRKAMYSFAILLLAILVLGVCVVNIYGKDKKEAKS